MLELFRKVASRAGKYIYGHESIQKIIVYEKRMNEKWEENNKTDE